jgi:probable addiction module antidote protein
MPSKSYKSWQAEKLLQPEISASYLNAAKKESPEAFRDALKNVIRAHQVAKVAKEAGIARENVYRAFSAQGNPTLDTLDSVLEVVGLKILIAPVRQEVVPPHPRSIPTWETSPVEIAGVLTPIQGTLGQESGIGNHLRIVGVSRATLGSPKLGKRGPSSVLIGLSEAKVALGELVNA